MTELVLPDEPRWVEAHGMAGDPDSWQRPLGAGVAIGNDAARLIVIAHEAEQGSIIALAAEYPDHTFLFVDDELAAALGHHGRSVERARLLTLTDPSHLPDGHGAVLLPGEASLAHLPAELAAELTWARQRHAIWTAYLDGLPVSFAHAPWRSTRWFDISVDTLPEARQLGLATLTAAAMIRAERDTGRQPVWGADESNHASLRLARRLGFTPVDEIWLALP